jgi:hypothetical protein
MRQHLLDRLLSWRNEDGGWGYYPGKASRLEPTSLALIAMVVSHVGQGFSPADEPSLIAGEAVVGQAFRPADVLSSFPARDNLLLDPGADLPNLASNAQAALALLAVGEESRARAIVDGLLAVKGFTVPRNDAVELDGSLAAWPWREGTFSWAEPTAWCLLAVKRVFGAAPTPLARERIDIAERMLADRMCVGGGWNYGNRVVLGQALPAHLPPTAVALLALADRPDLPAVRESLQFLSARRLAERSGLTLSLASICLQRYDLPVDDLGAALAATWAATGFMHHVPAVALASIAAVPPPAGSGPFHV